MLHLTTVPTYHRVLSRFLVVALLPGPAPGQDPPPLPLAVANNAVAALVTENGPTLFSFLGLDVTRGWRGITTRAFVLDPGASRWRELPPVPGPRGRLAATAQAVRGRVYLFGGYTVDSAGVEQSVNVVDIWDPATGAWSAGAPMPLGVDDAVSGVWRDSLIYLVSGWHDTDNTTRVQVYDPARDRWFGATPIPGPGVFGHAGAVAGDAILFVDGVRRNPGRPRYTLVAGAWHGTIDPEHPARITWRRVEDHPGPPRYRAAAGACGRLVVFAGGTDRPYNYDGVGYDGVPAGPLDGVVAYDTWTGRWLALGRWPVASMDHRGLPILGGVGWIVGGMRAGQQVTDQVITRPLPVCNPAPDGVPPMTRR